MALTQMLRAAKSELLVTPRHEEWLRSNSNVELDEQVAEWVKRELMSKQRDRTKSFSASSMGYCQRQQMFAYLDAKIERRPDSGAASIFIQGTWIHVKWQAMGYMAGWMGQTEVPVRIDAYNLRGTIDGILHPSIAEAGWELKSINARGYRWVMEHGPKLEHLKQIHAYMLATGLRLWSLIYEEKDTQAYKEFLVVFDDVIAEEVIEELDVLNDAVKTKTLPPMLEGCTKKNGMTYRSCAYRDQCPEATWPRRINLRSVPSMRSKETPIG